MKNYRKELRNLPDGLTTMAEVNNVIIQLNLD